MAWSHESLGVFVENIVGEDASTNSLHDVENEAVSMFLENGEEDECGHMHAKGKDPGTSKIPPGRGSGQRSSKLKYPRTAVLCVNHFMFYVCVVDER